MKILIVDDEALSLSSVKQVLSQVEGHQKNVEACDNGRTAIERIRRENFDIVLLDLLMPDVDGMQVLESTKPFCPGTEFIILTAVDDIKPPSGRCGGGLTTWSSPWTMNCCFCPSNGPMSEKDGWPAFRSAPAARRPIFRPHSPTRLRRISR